MRNIFKFSSLFKTVLDVSQDIEKKGEDDSDSEESDNDEEPEKQMGETEEGAER